MQISLEEKRKQNFSRGYTNPWKDDNFFEEEEPRDNQIRENYLLETPMPKQYAKYSDKREQNLAQESAYAIRNRTAVKKYFFTQSYFPKEKL